VEIELGLPLRNVDLGVVGEIFPCFIFSISVVSSSIFARGMPQVVFPRIMAEVAATVNEHGHDEITVAMKNEQHTGYDEMAVAKQEDVQDQLTSPASSLEEDGK